MGGSKKDYLLLLNFILTKFTRNKCAQFSSFAETTSLWVFTRVNYLEQFPGFPGISRNHGNLRGAICTRGATFP